MTTEMGEIRNLVGVLKRKNGYTGITKFKRNDQYARVGYEEHMNERVFYEWNFFCERFFYEWTFFHE